MSLICVCGNLMSSLDALMWYTDYPVDRQWLPFQGSKCAKLLQTVQSKWIPLNSVLQYDRGIDTWFLEGINWVVIHAFLIYWYDDYFNRWFIFSVALLLQLFEEFILCILFLWKRGGACVLFYLKGALCMNFSWNHQKDNQKYCVMMLCRLWIVLQRCLLKLAC